VRSGERCPEVLEEQARYAERVEKNEYGQEMNTNCKSESEKLCTNRVSTEYDAQRI